MIGAWDKSRLLRFALLAVGLGMMAVIGRELLSIGSGAAPLVAAAERPAPAPRAAPAGFRMPPARDFSEVLARPLFSPTRRPGAPAGRLAASSSFTLVGVVIAPPDRRALLGVGQGGKIIRVRVGQDVDGWSVEAILPDKVIIRHAEVREAVKPRDGGLSASGLALAAPAAPGGSVAVGGPPRFKWVHHSHDQ